MTAPIYVVDDEPYIRTAVLAVLTESGYEVEAFGSAQELYDRMVAGSPNPSLVIVDEMLPDESGDSIVRSLRQRAEYRETPFLFLTAVSTDAAERLTDLAPVIRKPFDFGDLVERVESMIGPSTASAVNSASTPSGS